MVGAEPLPYQFFPATSLTAFTGFSLSASHYIQQQPDNTSHDREMLSASCTVALAKLLHSVPETPIRRHLQSEISLRRLALLQPVKRGSSANAFRLRYLAHKDPAQKNLLPFFPPSVPFR